MSKPLKVLILEDHPFDAEILVSELEKAGFALEWQRIDTEADYLAHLTPALDLIVSDYTMPQFEAPRALQILQEKDLDIPFIVIIGTLREEMGVACLKQGAVDYLIKDRLARLGEAVKRALHQRALHEEKRQALTALRESEERFRTRYQETEALRQAALALVSTVDVDQVFEGILENLQNVVPVDCASLQLVVENRL
jgi:DNA-binding NtrC family response regulator